MMWNSPRPQSTGILAVCSNSSKRNLSYQKNPWFYTSLHQYCDPLMLSCVQLFVTPGTVAHQAPLSMGFSGQEYWSGLPFPSPGDLPDPEIKSRSPALQADSLPFEPPGKPYSQYVYAFYFTSLFHFWKIVKLKKLISITKLEEHRIVRESVDSNSSQNSLYATETAIKEKNTLQITAKNRDNIG